MGNLLNFTSAVFDVNPLPHVQKKLFQMAFMFQKNCLGVSALAP
jgi:hypothetical protein